MVDIADCCLTDAPASRILDPRPQETRNPPSVLPGLERRAGPPPALLRVRAPVVARSPAAPSVLEPAAYPRAVPASHSPAGPCRTRPARADLSIAAMLNIAIYCLTDAPASRILDPRPQETRNPPSVLPGLERRAGPPTGPSPRPGTGRGSPSGARRWQPGAMPWLPRARRPGSRPLTVAGATAALPPARHRHPARDRAPVAARRRRARDPPRRPRQRGGGAGWPRQRAPSRAHHDGPGWQHVADGRLHPLPRRGALLDHHVRPVGRPRPPVPRAPLRAGGSPPDLAHLLGRPAGGLRRDRLAAAPPVRRIRRHRAGKPAVRRPPARHPPRLLARATRGGLQRGVPPRTWARATPGSASWSAPSDAAPTGGRPPCSSPTTKAAASTTTSRPRSCPARSATAPAPRSSSSRPTPGAAPTRGRPPTCRCSPSPSTCSACHRSTPATPPRTTSPAPSTSPLAHCPHPAGVPRPAGIPAAVAVRDGAGRLVLDVAMPGYYRLTACGPDGSVGWCTLDVGVGPNTP